MSAACAPGACAASPLRLLNAASSAPGLPLPAGHSSVVGIRVRWVDRLAVAYPAGPERREIDAAVRWAHDQPGDRLTDRWRDLETHAGEPGRHDQTVQAGWPAEQRPGVRGHVVHARDPPRDACVLERRDPPRGRLD